MTTRTIHPFPARMAPEIALKAIPARGLEELSVLDPMCGSGTVLSVAVTRGHRAHGIDIDPLAVLMSQVATAPIDSSRVIHHAAKAVEIAKHAPGVAPWGDDQESEKFVDFWFAEHQKEQLIALSSAISTVESMIVRQALEVALSRIIVTKTPRASLAADTSHSRPHKVLQTSDYDVMGGFIKSAHQLAQKLEQRDMAGRATASLGDARSLSHMPASSIDLVVTSPPYLNALDYLRGHKLALVWLGHTIPELRHRRSTSIGSERLPDEASSAEVTHMVEVIENEVADKDLLKRGMVERFAQDCAAFSHQLRHVVKPDGTAVLVVGNSTLRGNYIRNDRITQMAMERAGFVVQDRYERDIPPSKRYMAIASRSESSITKRMRTEVVLTMGS